ncbi:uncharacterized protein LOC129778696 [Toxorhynchites rutilus septentrionalis]|uniref:uncharacterized protein LOC129778696 n=1 Tax=Toxorhynchites rutilus septentrionalis TaxID=329112 RepID=UPI0024786799|nr:uncharacterized protein LOC129778696 [Toxorhynchites rutilus septentrionalis]
MISPITTVRISTSITAANNIRPASVTSNPCWQCRGTASTAAAAEFDHGMVLRRTFPIRGSVLRAHSKILFRHENSTTRRYLSTCSAELPPRRNPNALIPLYSRMEIGEPTASAFPQQYPLSPGCYSGEHHQQQPQQDLAIDSISSNFPHRRSRASRTLKNPPQPHICVIKGKEVFINVLSRI